MDESVEEKSFEPGSARFGNFINYYSFNPPNCRLDQIPPTLLHDCFPDISKDTGLVALDIGCNSGSLTVAMYEHLTANHQVPLDQFHILACDLDPVLIERAQETTKYPHNIQYVTLDIMKHALAEEVMESFIKKYSKSKLDITFCFSITMWIHLQNGDDGLKRFLKEVALRTQYLLIEPQPWKCYKSAMRRVRKLDCDDFVHFKNLKLRNQVEEEINNFLKYQCSMEVMAQFGSTRWKRKLTLYRNKR
ncbi:PREDICTED: pre-miRNA 5'-monophosphate methyltransferase-like [Priapulus caudatus]|uniref:RNA methyltransferase n=1 Tax=Priapulus caudatus TaxID=37621 RepID=A0ABM1FBU7_PRICU|nr:PREDICTED: pre-miRNA 5'-monophosphate methyltransferase-like [Priapulus caudatus]